MFKERFFTWFDSYDIYDENENTVYTVEGELSWGKKLNVYSASGEQLAVLQQRVLTFLPTFEIYIGGEFAGEIKKEFTFFTPSFDIDYLGWHVEGEWLEWDYTILNSEGESVAKISKELFQWTDTYCIDVVRQEDALNVLMLVLAIDAEKASRG